VATGTITARTVASRLDGSGQSSRAAAGAVARAMAGAIATAAAIRTDTDRQR
jgi:hypothetical protein